MLYEAGKYSYFYCSVNIYLCRVIMEVICLNLGPTLISQTCLRTIWVLMSLHLLSLYIKNVIFIIIIVLFNNDLTTF